MYMWGVYTISEFKHFKTEGRYYFPLLIIFTTVWRILGKTLRTPPIPTIAFEFSSEIRVKYND